jgi:molybdopterin molybdotransferase
MQPGKPQGFGRWPDSGDVPGPLIFALPGNPVSAYVSFEVFVRPALRRLLGHGTAKPIEPADTAVTGRITDGTDIRSDASQDHPDLHRRTITATVVSGWKSPPGRAQYMPVIVTHRTGAGTSAGTVTGTDSGSGADEKPDGPHLEVRPASRGGSGSHLVAGLAQATGLAIVPEDKTHVRGGDLITVMLTS